ncbi:hypothetical protein ACFL21_02240 [Patescibacteria group bacterium]
MDLIPLPYEHVITEFKKGQKSSKEIQRLLQDKLKTKGDNRDQKLVKNTCHKLFKYLENAGEHNLGEVGELLNSLERSIMTIQRHKKKLVIEKNKQIRNNKRPGTNQNF